MQRFSSSGGFSQHLRLLTGGTVQRLHHSIDFDRINEAAMGCLEAVCRRLLSNGRREGHEFVARNPVATIAALARFKMSLRPASGPTCQWRQG